MPHSSTNDDELSIINYQRRSKKRSKNLPKNLLEILVIIIQAAYLPLALELTMYQSHTYLSYPSIYDIYRLDKNLVPDYSIKQLSQYVYNGNNHMVI